MVDDHCAKRLSVFPSQLVFFFRDYGQVTIPGLAKCPTLNWIEKNKMGGLYMVTIDPEKYLATFIFLFQLEIVVFTYW